MFDISFFDAVYRLWKFHDLLRVTFPLLQLRYIAATRRRQQQTIARLKQKERITVAFFLQTPSTWKYESLFLRMQQSERFNPVIVVCPYNVHLNYSKAECLRVISQTEAFAKAQGYNYISTYDAQDGRWLNVKKTLNPDVIFFTKPYKDTLPAYYVYRFREKITCYVPYGVAMLGDAPAYPRNFNLPFHNLVYHFLLETPIHKQFAQQYSLVKGTNVKVVGNLGMEMIMDTNHVPQDVWKPQSALKKRIIWAPHHTIDYMFNFSSFLSYCDFMLEMAEKYKDKLQFAFKPHPVLKFRLLNLWGNEKTEAYYNQWRNLENTQLEEGYYIDLFLTSDAMIHDSVTFTAEYLHTQKPVCFTLRNEKIKEQWNPFGEKAFNLHYHANNETEIENFILQVVMNETDPMVKERKEFFDTYLYPEDGIMPSEKILKILEEEIS
jgi:hypothetical protein